METEYEALAGPSLGKKAMTARDQTPLKADGGPLYVAVAPAGFPSPAHDYLENRLDLNEHLIKHPAATYFVRVSGDSMTGAGIFPGDILIVDRSLDPVDRKIVIAVLNGELTVKRLRRSADQIRLVAENTAYQPIVITEDTILEIWGVVTTVIHSV